MCGIVGSSSALGSLTVVGVCWCAVLWGGHLLWVLLRRWVCVGVRYCEGGSSAVCCVTAVVVCW